MSEAFFDPNRHVAVINDEIPDEDAADLEPRADIEPPSPYRRKAVVVHRRTKERAVVHRVDFVTRQIRLWYPKRAEMGLDKKAQFDERTEWRSFDDWEPEITESPEETERQAALKQFADELQGFDVDELEVVRAFCDDDDPRKALKKLQAFKRMQIAGGGTAPKAAKASAADNMPEEPAKKGGK